MNELFSSKNNIFFTKLSANELLELLVSIENFYLEYRNTLYLPIYETFGIEIEYEKFSENKTNKYISTYFNKWESTDDGSLVYGGEIISPIMRDLPTYWDELKNICDYLNKHNVNTSLNAGGHVHIGANILEDNLDYWKTFIKLYTVYEDTLFRFIYGDKISPRSKIRKYAPPIAKEFYRIINNFDDIENISGLFQLVPKNRYFALNLRNAVANYYLEDSNSKNTIEFRSPNATSNPIIWQNNINTFCKMLLSSSMQVIDTDFLDWKLENDFVPFCERRSYSSDYLYDEINLKNILEFVDIIFDNNLDKVYFLRQYLKNFEGNYGINKAVKAKRFVKK